MSSRARHVPAESLPPAAVDIQGLRAGFISRLIAGGIDYATIAIVTIGAYVGLALLRFLIDPRSYRPPHWIGLVWCAISRENRSLQDIVLRTSVVHDWPRSLADVEILNTSDRRLDLGHAGPTTPDA